MLWFFYNFPGIVHIFHFGDECLLRVRENKSACGPDSRLVESAARACPTLSSGGTCNPPRTSSDPLVQLTNAPSPTDEQGPSPGRPPHLHMYQATAWYSNLLPPIQVACIMIFLMVWSLVGLIPLHDRAGFPPKPKYHHPVVIGMHNAHPSR